MEKGKNTPLLNIPPGVFRNSTRYATGSKWYDANQVRWRNNILVPIGGWEGKLTFSAATTPIRKMHSWFDDESMPWLAAGSSDKLFAASYDDDADYTNYDITPSGLGWNPGGILGYGRDYYGSGFYGVDPEVVVTTSNGMWSMDNFGKSLIAVHSQDGRLVSWDPVTPATIAAVVTNAPTGNLLCISTDEEHVMVMGGADKPRDIDWCARRAITTWTPAPDNNAGGFSLQSAGAIVAAVRVQGGILVLTNNDAHLIEYVGPPNYYSRRRISDEAGVIGRNSVIPFLGGAIWMDHQNIWEYSGGRVAKFECSVQDEIFKNSNLTDPNKIHFGINEYAQEVWIHYPAKDDNENSRYAIYSYAQTPYWSIGALSRTAMVNPVWQTQPLMVSNKDMYQHETGMLADGETRVGEVYAETGGLDLSEGDVNTFVDRIYNDSGADMPDVEADDDAYRLYFILQQAPKAAKRTIGPIALTNPKGYTRVRFRARQMYMRVETFSDEFWKLGNIRLRIKGLGSR